MDVCTASTHAEPFLNHRWRNINITYADAKQVFAWTKPFGRHDTWSFRIKPTLRADRNVISSTHEPFLAAASGGPFQPKDVCGGRPRFTSRPPIPFWAPPKCEDKRTQVCLHSGLPDKNGYDSVVLASLILLVICVTLYAL